MQSEKKNALVLGGTGAMGISLVGLLVDKGFNVFVTSRKERQSERKEVAFVKGNAKDLSFLQSVLSSGVKDTDGKSRPYDVIIDFMSYKTADFKERADLFLESAGQYVFISSARVYAPSQEPLTESSKRLLDVCDDAEYLRTDEYALAKARQEDILRSKNGRNYTIVRPSLTYNKNRLQLAISEKEEWLYRVLHGRSVVLPEDMMNVITPMTFGGDVAKGIACIAGNEKALGETFHIASPEFRTWGEILDIYQSVIEEKTGTKMKVVFVPSALEIGKKLGRYYQIKYARFVNRKFDSSKIEKLSGGMTFTPPEEGLRQALSDFLDAPVFSGISVRSHAFFDRVCRETTALKEIGSFKRCAKYLVFRYSPYFDFRR